MAPRRAWLLLLTAATTARGAAVTAAPLVTVFAAYTGVPGFPTCFRQPVLVVLDALHLMAFAEGRDNGYCSGAADGKNSSVWLRTSADAGATWSPPKMLYDAPPQVRRVAGARRASASGS